MVFAVILIALGIDFAVHFVTHYERALISGAGPSKAISITYKRAGGALWMGGITTAAAFLSAFFTDFVGLSELGLISGLGLIVCLVCMCIVYPSMLYLVDSKNNQSENGRLSRLNRADLSLLTTKHPLRSSVILGITLIMTAGGYIFGQYYFDTNLLNLQSTNGEANRWQKLLMSTEDIATFAIALYPDQESLERVENRFRSSTNLVRRTESLYPERIDDKRVLLSSLCTTVSDIEFGSFVGSDVFNTRRQIWNLRQKIRKFQETGEKSRRSLSTLVSSVETVYRKLRELPDEVIEKRLSEIDKELVLSVRKYLPKALEFVCPPDFSPGLLPHSLRNRFLGLDGSLALYVYPKKNVWNREELNEFVEQARVIEPRLFGEVISFYENGGALIRSFLQTALYSLVTIFVMLYVWSRSLRSTLIALSPLLVSAGLLLGLMR